MGYQALLFCPDEKTARTVTQVLSELEFNVEPCTEPFAAVKKLMGQHFDAVVVDCDNEQNATLLFKSARNSTSNQTSLAVAVVEGQAGVAKAFRIGANLVLTKPINIEQTKGTLRVARGLLRKSDPTKGTGSAATTSAAPSTQAAKPTAPKPPVPVAPQATSPRPPEIPIARPTTSPAWPSAAVASATASPKDSATVEARAQQPVSVPPAPAPSLSVAAAPVLNAPVAPVAQPKSAVAPPQAVTSSGAAAAPALVRTTQENPVAPSPASNAIADVVIDSPDATAVSEPITAPAPAVEPSFTFGGANVEPQAGSGNKRIYFGIAAAAFIASALYFGWAQFQTMSAPKASAPVSAAPAASAPAPVAPGLSKPAATTTAAPAHAVTETKLDPIVDNSASPANDVTVRNIPGSTKSSNPSAALTKPATVSEETIPAPLVVKSGKTPASGPVADAPAPSMIGMATPGAAAPPPNLVPATGKPFKPLLQTLNISQGVSQGLVIKKVSPTYPANLLRTRTEGSVQLLATISKDGDITHIKTISGDPQLVKAASDAVKQWKYKPYLLNGEPLEIQTQITVNFKLPK